MDFMYDHLSDGRSYRLFNVIDDFNREALAIVRKAWNRTFQQAAQAAILENRHSLQWPKTGLFRVIFLGPSGNQAVKNRRRTTVGQGLYPDFDFTLYRTYLCFVGLFTVSTWRRIL